MPDERDQRKNIDIDKIKACLGMMNSSDSAERTAALSAISGISGDEMIRLLSDPDTPVEILEYFARHAGNRPEWHEALEKNPTLPKSSTEFIAQQKQASGLHERLPSDPPPSEAQSGEKGLKQKKKVHQMSVGEKIITALRGGKEERTVLIKDGNRQVFMSVLGNPGLTESEVEMMTKTTSTNSDVLRAIGKNKEWTNKRNIIKSLVLNPKTPPDISIKYLSRLTDKELDIVEKSRAIPSAVRMNAKKILSLRRQRR